MESASGGDAEPSQGSVTAFDVSVVIPVFNDIDGLTSCVEGLAAQKLDPGRFEVLVVDNGPADGAERRLAEISRLLEKLANGTVFNEPQPGSYAARNLALQHAQGGVFAFTDADCIPTPEWLAAGLAFLDQHPDISAAAGAIKLFPRDPNNRTAAELYELRHGFQVQRYIETASYGPTANLFVRRTAIDEIGPFDSKLLSGGDKEWGMRLKKHGGRLVYAPAAVVRHPARRSLEELRLKAKRVVGGDVAIRRRQGWSRLNWLRYSLQPLRPPLRTIWNARRDPTLSSMRDLVLYGGAFILNRWMTALYRLRALLEWPAA